MTAARFGALSLAIATAGGCRHPTPAEPRVVYVPAPCLAAAPPSPPGPTAIAGPEEGCADPRGCITPALYLWVTDALRWMRGAWTNCGPDQPAQGDER